MLFDRCCRCNTTSAIFTSVFRRFSPWRHIKLSSELSDIRSDSAKFPCVMDPCTRHCSEVSCDLLFHQWESARGSKCLICLSTPLKKLFRNSTIKSAAIQETQQLNPVKNPVYIFIVLGIIKSRWSRTDSCVVLLIKKNTLIPSSFPLLNVLQVCKLN